MERGGPQPGRAPPVPLPPGQRRHGDYGARLGVTVLGGSTRRLAYHLTRARWLPKDYAGGVLYLDDPR